MEDFKEIVLREVRQQMESTVISYEQRDPVNKKWGNPSYNGNCSGKVPLGFIDKLGAKSVCEAFAGSGTLSDVCRDFGIPYCGVDLNPTPVRDNIISMDLLDLSQELPDMFYNADMAFSHPPYPGINRIKYAGNEWKDVNDVASKDIQNMNFYKGMQAVNTAHLRVYTALPKGSYLVMLVGEIRSKGQYYSMYQNLALPGEIFQSYVKLQHNTWSGRQSYSGKSSNQRALTGHEMIAIVKKPSGYEVTYVLPRRYSFDIRTSNMATWKDLVMAYAREEREFSNTQIANDLQKHKKTSENNNVAAKLRQTCQYLEKTGLLKHIATGKWAISA